MPDTTPTDPTPWQPSRIEDYALIGDCATAALVSRNGSIDWLCWPNFASGACFAALLGDGNNGHWSIRPHGVPTSSSRSYQDSSMILETRFVTPEVDGESEGEICVTDFMPLVATPREGDHSSIVRMVRGVRGLVPVRMELALRFDYGLTIPWVTTNGNEVRAVSGPNMVVLRSQCASNDIAVDMHGEGLTTVGDFTLRQGDEVCFILTYADSMEAVPPPVSAADALSATRSFWAEWNSRCQYKGDDAQAVQRSLMTLKAMTYRPTAGVVAAVTAGLPEEIGGERNWDYRYCWLRDTSFTLLVLLRAGYTEEATAWRRWLLRTIAGAPDQIQSLYSIAGERRLIEWKADWLPGYEGSQPVRIGNEAFLQFQLDIFGEVGIAMSRAPDSDDDVRVPAKDLQAALTDHVCKIWQQPDDGIWETRGGRQHFVHSKAMAWAALDRAIKDDLGIGDTDRWRENRDRVHAEICERGFNKKLNAFTQVYGSDVLDASVLRMVFVGFLPLDDPRIVGTVEAVQKHLTQDGLVLRYRQDESPDGLKGTEGTFLACSFWLVTCLHLIGRQDEARQMFDRLLALCNDVGLLSEEYDPKAERMLGNFPQALSHIALVHAAFTLSGQWHPDIDATM